MATKVYETATAYLLDGTELNLMPLKIKYLRLFMEKFDSVKTSMNDEEAIEHLAECATITMKQFCPRIKTVNELEDNMDLPTIYKILDVAAGIKIKEDSEKEVKEQATESGASWDELDLAKIESEVFLLGIWKDYDELETSLSMPELITTLSSKRDLDYDEKKFLAAIQGVDLDKNSGKKEEDPWEKMKAKVFSGGATTDSNDILAHQGITAQQNGFGIGMGLDHTVIGSGSDFQPFGRKK